VSRITDIVIVTSLDENEEPIQFINDYFEQEMSSVGRPFKEIGRNLAGGNKTFCGRLYAASINALRVTEFIEMARAAPWVAPEAVQLLIQREVDGGFRRIDLSKNDDPYDRNRL
jgi:hypothetical protein